MKGTTAVNEGGLIQDQEIELLILDGLSRSMLLVSSVPPIS